MVREFLIYTENKHLSELGVSNTSDAPLAIDMRRIESIWKNIHDDTGEEGTTITLFSGDNFTVKSKYEDVLELWLRVLSAQK